jgi:hypothetical protein
VKGGGAIRRLFFALPIRVTKLAPLGGPWFRESNAFAHDTIGQEYDSGFF